MEVLQLDPQRYVALLSKLVGEAEKLQNNPAQGLYPQEALVARHVVEALAPYTLGQEGGVLKVEQVGFTEGRCNLIITYPGTEPGASVAFVGSHMDVVPANPETWQRDPFKLTVEGDNLYGRGTTDCLGHVALITELLLQLAITKPKLRRTVTAVFICNEENGVVEGIGVDQLMETGKMDHIKSGPVFWIDVADMHPCIGTAGSLTWTLKATGKLFHSGLPHKGINALELANAAVAELQTRFYKDFPGTEKEEEYNFATPSTMKPTQVQCAVGSLNQLPPWVEVSGDIRLTPFYEVEDVRKAVEAYVADLNANITSLPTFGPCSKYEIEGAKGSLELSWGAGYMEGIACSLSSDGHHALMAATEQVLGEAKAYSICGSLPLVRNLQRAGFDVQMTGYGKMSVYHADNEYCSLTDMSKGFDILIKLLTRLEGK
ncbi:hypothetical protein AB1Y20_004165 [Prymnesium parvum]|uniref:Peptidase M20 dimerisation domain-containing protein n=1 Tax=Prymnesium parvum TaxID=97485 RepID=A0AB34J9Q2_PRYPA